MIQLALRDSISVYKAKGKVSMLEEVAKDKAIKGIVGIAHTRWTTHGEPSVTNAHPHLSDSGNLALVHNGIIENFSVLRDQLKKISYIHAEGYPAAEMKHGPIAIIDADIPVLFVATHHQQYQKIVSNMEEVKARGGRITAVVTKGDEQIREIADQVIEVPIGRRKIQSCYIN